MPVSLEQIVAAARQRTSRPRRASELAELERRAAAHAPRGFAAALRRISAKRPAVIAELKKASPSRGVIRGSFHPAALAWELAEAGAAALSVLTDEEFFQGSLSNLIESSTAVDLPCLRKDFIVSEAQIVEARAFGADAVLLIVAALSDMELRTFRAAAERHNLDVLCEVHDRDELSRALDIGFDVIGVNSRDLRTFEVKLETALQLARDIPPGTLKVAESGIHTGDDLRRLCDAGYDAFLVGESLMKAEHPGAALRELLAGAQASSELRAKRGA